MNPPSRILYSMCYDMQAQPHRAYKTSGGLAISCAQTETWIWLAPHTDARVFFANFLRQNSAPLPGIVAEKNVALACAEVYGKPCTKKELVSYFLPQEVGLPPAVAGKLRSPTPQEAPQILGWISDFYREALDKQTPSELAPMQKKFAPQSLNLFLWDDSRPVAMGMLSGAGETARLNLIYVPPGYRGRGYGRAIICALASNAREAKRLPVLYTAADNPANALYIALGFKEAGRLLEIRF